MASSLAALFEKHGSDKNRNGYTCIYDSLWKNIRDKPVVILEIGVGCKWLMGKQYEPGASLKAWAEYFPNSTVFGTDIAKDAVNLKLMNGRVTTHECNSTDEKQVKHFVNQLRTKLNIESGPVFDIIIDDGSHLESDQIKTLRNLFMEVKEGGYYILEDIGGNMQNISYKTCRKFPPPRSLVLQCNWCEYT